MVAKQFTRKSEFLLISEKRYCSHRQPDIGLRMIVWRYEKTALRLQESQKKTVQGTTSPLWSFIWLFGRLGFDANNALAICSGVLLMGGSAIFDGVLRSLFFFMWSFLHILG